MYLVVSLTLLMFSLVQLMFSLVQLMFFFSPLTWLMVVEVNPVRKNMYYTSVTLIFRHLGLLSVIFHPPEGIDLPTFTNSVFFQEKKSFLSKIEEENTSIFCQFSDNLQKKNKKLL